MTIDASFSIKNFKCFGEQGANFPSVKYINVIIGKNNIGKSTIIDAIGELCQTQKSASDVIEKIEQKTEMTASTLRPYFPENIGGPEGNYWHDMGAKLVGATATWKHVPPHGKMLLNVDRECSEDSRSKLQIALNNTPDPFANLIHRRLLAERDIVPEADSQSPSLSYKGVGATTLIHSFLHHSHRDREVIRTKLLDALNSILAPDTKFIEISTRYHANGNNVWEIYLTEDNETLIPLSASGSGLKTIILVLLNLIAIPIHDANNASKYIFSFEELENNLHPTLQRNLFLFLEKFATQNECHIFLTTHSNIAIDIFSNSAYAQINHIQRQNDKSFGTIFRNTTDGYGILNDLGVKASDILQSNGVIWVEGPSDRVYLNKLINLWSDGELREGAHYQFVFYGGSVLANLDANTPQSQFDQTVSAFRINRNLIFVCDSDKRSPEAPLKKRVQDLLNELQDTSAYCWVTQCKEIENYIPKEVFQVVHTRDDLTHIGEHQIILDYLKDNGLTQASEYRDKHHKAILYSEHFTTENMAFRPEIDQVITQICNVIKGWNHIKF